MSTPEGGKSEVFTIDGHHEVHVTTTDMDEETLVRTEIASGAFRELARANDTSKPRVVNQLIL